MVKNFFYVDLNCVRSQRVTLFISNEKKNTQLMVSFFKNHSQRNNNKFYDNIRQNKNTK